jgi:hypothetical protein
VRRSLMWNLGAFVGGIARGVKAPLKPLPMPPKPEPENAERTEARAGALVVRTDVQERVVETAGGPVTLRRTVIDEVEPGGADRSG